MRARRQLQPGEPDNFDILAPEASRSFVLRLAERVGLAAGPISLMALLAAVVVVTNTILVSVTQRTREIGVRRALGATRAQVMAEVLAESVLIAVLGGGVGIALVVALVSVAGALGLALELDAGTAARSLLAAAVSGLVAGWYPARRATQIDVIEALRVE
jgi:putative ABC transport system permease protein